MKNAGEYIEELIDNTDRKSRFYRRWGIFLAVLFMLLAFTGLIFFLIGLGGQGKFIYLYAIVLALALSFATYLTRTLLALSNAYALRSGHLEDLKTFLLLCDNDAVSCDTLLNALVTLRRGVLEEMVKVSVLGQDSLLNQLKDAIKTGKDR